MIKKRFLLLVLTGLSLSGIAQDDNMRYESPSGLLIEWSVKGEGKQAMQGDMVTVHYTGRLTDSTVFDSSVKRNAPFSFRLGRGQVIKGWEEGISQLHVGDKAVLTIPPEIAYGSTDKGTIPPNSTLIFDVELLSLVEGIRPFVVDGLDTTYTPDSIGIIWILNNEEHPVVKTGQLVTVHYTGYFLDGRVFDSSVERGEPIKFPLGKGMVIPGWERSFTYMSKGDKARILIPYAMAYGEEGVQGIPPFSDLLFDVELIDVEDVDRPEPYDVNGKDTITTSSALQVIKIVETTAVSPLPGATVNVHYTGYFTDGSIFDSSYNRGLPFSFPLGQQRVIKGWDEGLALMHYGEKARLIIPYQLAYGEMGRGEVIPPKATLIFDVYLLPQE